MVKPEDLDPFTRRILDDSFASLEQIAKTLTTLLTMIPGEDARKKVLDDGVDAFAATVRMLVESHMAEIKKQFGSVEAFVKHAAGAADIDKKVH